MPAKPIKLPFGQIPPGAFDAAFTRPKSQATGLPMGVEQLAKDPAGAPLRGTGLPAGVESQAKAKLNTNVGPMPPMIVNGGMQFQAPAKPNAPLPAVAAQPETVMPPTRPQGPAAPRLPISNLGTSITPPNSLSRGARPGSASSLGGPVKVGRSANDPMRIAETARRRGNIGPIMDLAKTQMQEDRADARTERGEQRADARYDQQRRDRMDEWTQSQAAEAARDERENNQQTQRDEREATRRAGESAADYRQRREDAMADEERRAKAARETYPIIDPITGQKHEGHFMTGNGMMAPRKVPDAPLPPTFEPKSINRDGTLYGPKDQVTMEPPKLPDGIQYEKDPDTGKITSGVYPKYDPQTGTWKLTRMDLNGDGVIDPAEKAAATAATTQEPGVDADWRNMPSGPARSYASVGASPDGKPQPKTPALQSVIGRFKK